MKLAKLSLFILIFCLIGCARKKSSLPVTTINDFSRLNQTDIHAYVTPESYTELATLVEQARKEKRKIAVAGARHSQGGQAFCPDGIIISLKKLNSIISLDHEQKLLTVQAGATWKQVQEYLNDHGLAVKIMQFANMFTIGGAISVNANGIDPHCGPFIESVRSLKVMQPDGVIVIASRTENPDLFALVIGGYGLFGIVLEVTIEVVENSIYRRESQLFTVPEYIDHLHHIKNDPTVGFHYAQLRLSTKKLASGVVSFDFKKLDEKTFSPYKLKSLKKLSVENFISFKKWSMYLLHKISFLKSIQWIPEAVLLHGTIISRNNIMSPPVSHVHSHLRQDTALLQEYFIPLRNGAAFIQELEYISKKLNMNILYVALRFVPKNTECFLPYTREDCMGIVVFFSQQITPEDTQKTQDWTRYLINAAGTLHGTYYLPIQLHATKRQLQQIYPDIDLFFAMKQYYDPQEIFMNHFYKKYA